jgi:hypothetical protein
MCHFCIFAENEQNYEPFSLHRTRIMRNIYILHKKDIRTIQCPEAQNRDYDRYRAGRS